MTAPSQRIVPELLHSGSPEAKRTLLEIGDNSVVASLCNILRDDSSTAGQVEFARDCLRGLNKQLISDYVLGSAKEWRTRDCFGKALAVLNVFRDFADEKLNASIAELQNLLEQKHHTALHQFRTHLSSCSFEEAGAALRSFEHTEGTAPDFVDLLRVREKLERSWNSLTLLVHDASGSEEEQLKQIQKTSEEIESLCQQLGVDVNSLKEKLVSICGRWLEKESDYSRKRRWVQRMNAVAPWKTESLKRFLGW